VFAAQARVPVDRAHREQILLALADAGPAVVKLRAWSEEQQTHNETWSYPDLMDELVAQRRVPESSVAFVGGSMQEVLHKSRGFVTVSSTAALEAIAMNRSTLIISDFGVSAEMINLVFQESGCLGTLDDLRSGRLGQPDPLWGGQLLPSGRGEQLAGAAQPATRATCCRTAACGASPQSRPAGGGYDGGFV
jgi:hypothetical protein